MRLGPQAKRALSRAIIGTALLGAILSQGYLKMLRSEGETLPALYHVPKAQSVRLVLLGHEAFAADLIWIRTLGYFADELLGQQQFTFLEGLVALATDLDGRFEKVYMWAGAIFMYNSGRITNREILASNRILEKGWRYIQNDPRGWRHHPDYWLIPQMIGFNYAVELKDRKRGAPFIAAAAKIPGSPDFYKTWAATLYRKAGDIEKATEVLEDMLAIETLNSQLEAVENKTIRKRIEDRLDHYYARLPKEKAEEQKRLRRELMRLHRNWVTEYPFINFDLFLLLAPEEEDFDKDWDRRWNRFFPATEPMTNE